MDAVEQPRGPAPRARAAPGCCRRPPSGSTPGASSGPTRCGSASSGSTSTPRRSGSSSAPTPATARGPRRGPRHRRARAARCRTPRPGPGGMLVGTVEEVGPESPLGLAVGDRVATLVSLTLTPLVIEDGLARWDGRSEQVPCDGYAILFGRSIAAVLPDDLPAALSLAVMDVCGAPALTARVVGQYGRAPSSRWSGEPASPGRCRWPRPRPPARHDDRGGAAPRRRPTCSPRPRSPTPCGRRRPRPGRPVRPRSAKAGGPADVTVVCVDVPGCEGGAILSTADGGTVVFFSMATSFSAAALGAEGLAATSRCWSATATCPATPTSRCRCCARTAGSAVSSSGGCEDAAMTRTLLRGGRVHAPDDVHATALCVEDGTIVWTGADDAAIGFEEGADRVVDLAGRLVTPAFVDAHAHLAQTGFATASVDLSCAASMHEALDMVASRRQRLSDRRRARLRLGRHHVARAPPLHPCRAGPRHRRARMHTVPRRRALRSGVVGLSRRRA